jgi:hypothetical protein
LIFAFIQSYKNITPYSKSNHISYKFANKYYLQYRTDTINNNTMYTKEEAKNIKIQFWENFKQYTKEKIGKKRWLLRNISIKYSQLKFDADRNHAIVGIQIDSKKDIKRHMIYDTVRAYKIVIEDICGEDLIWEKEYLTEDNRSISMVYYKLDNVNLFRKEDQKKIYDFFIEKMTLLELAYLEIKDSIVQSIKDQHL